MALFEYDIPDLRLGEFDLGGVLYHANYYHLYEQAREALLRSGGTPYPGLVDNGFHLAVVEAQQSFMRPIYYGEQIRVKVACAEIGSSTLTLRYEISAGRGETLEKAHSGSTKLVFVANSGGRLKPSRMPENLITIFQDISER